MHFPTIYIRFPFFNVTLFCPYEKWLAHAHILAHAYASRPWVAQMCYYLKWKIRWQNQLNSSTQKNVPHTTYDNNISVIITLTAWIMYLYPHLYIKGRPIEIAVKKIGHLYWTKAFTRNWDVEQNCNGSMNIELLNFSV